MIRTTSFYPFMNLLHITQEFHEDKAIVKTKSLKHEREFEFSYKDIEEISDSFSPNNSQGNFGFWMIVSAAFSLGVFNFFISRYPFLLHIVQVIFTCGILLLATSFKKTWRIFFSDNNGNVLTAIKQTPKNRDLIPQIMEMIRANSNRLQEISVTNPFPEEPASLELVYYNLSDWVKTTDKFYEDKVIGYQKTIFEEGVYQVKYSQLSGEVYRGKTSIEVWGWSLTLFTLIASLIGGFLFGFGIKLDITLLRGGLYTIYVFLSLFLLSLPISLIKRDTIGFYNKNGKIEYWAQLNKKDKNKLEEIIKFVQSKIIANQNTQPLKEY